jgi:hypothetical protein
LRRQAPQRTTAERGGIDGSCIAGNQPTIALALAEQEIIDCIDSSITAPVANFVMLAAPFTCRPSGSHTRRENQTRACERSAIAQARRWHPTDSSISGRTELRQLAPSSLTGDKGPGQREAQRMVAWSARGAATAFPAGPAQNQKWSPLPPEPGLICAFVAEQKS